MQKAGALGLAAAVPASLFSGNAIAASPKRGGHMRVATELDSSADQLDPRQLSSGHTNFLWYSMHNSFIRYFHFSLMISGGICALIIA